jgi:hypothetical protein
MPGKIQVSNQAACAGLKRAEISLVKTHADGRVENLGVVAAADFGTSSILTRFLNWLGV